jgi:hypothetical protein
MFKYHKFYNVTREQRKEKERKIQEIITMNRNLPPGLLDAFIANKRSELPSYSTFTAGIASVSITLAVISLFLAFILNSVIYFAFSLFFLVLLFVGLIIIESREEEFKIQLDTLTWLRYRDEL